MKATLKKTKKQYDTHMEHYLVPTALFLLNIAAVHVVYAWFNITEEQRWYLVLLAIALTALGSSVWIKNRIYLWTSIIYYLLIFAYCWL